MQRFRHSRNTTNESAPQNWFSRHRVLFVMQLFILLLLSLILYSIYIPDKSGFVAKTVTKTIEKVVPGGSSALQQSDSQVLLTIFAVVGVISIVVSLVLGYLNAAKIRDLYRNRNLKIETKRAMQSGMLSQIDDFDEVFAYMDKERLGHVIDEIHDRNRKGLTNDDEEENLEQVNKMFAKIYEYAKQLRDMSYDVLEQINEDRQTLGMLEENWGDYYKAQHNLDLN